MTATKRCPRCGQLKAPHEFYWRHGGRCLSPYCQPCSRAASLETRRRWRQDPGAAERLGAVDRACQRRRRALGGQGGEDR